jgi:hypothetical protein
MRLVNKGLPSQMLPVKQKETDEWQHANMDRLEQIGRQQFMDNLKILENYEMTGGKFIATHYMENDQYQDMLSQLSAEFDLPNYLRHYDIISPIINTMSGEMQEHPDNFRIRRYDDGFTNAFIREKTRMMMRFINEDMQIEIDKALVSMGFNPNADEVKFDSEEQRQQYVQTLDQKRKELTPKDIEYYMHYKWHDLAELWGQHQTEHDNEHFNRKEKDRIEFEDLLKTASCYRHFYVSGDHFCEETWNPISTFKHKSPDTPNPEDGDYIGQQFYLTPAAFLNRYGRYLTAEQMKQFDPDDREFKDKKKKEKLSGTGPADAWGIPYGSLVPWINYPDHKLQVEALGFDPLNPIPAVDDSFWATLHSGYYNLNTEGLVMVTEAYWRSRKKEGYYTFIDPELGMIRNIIVDEDFEWPEGTKVYDNELWTKYKDTPGTLTWTWTDEIWMGVKAGTGNTRLEEDLYINVHPCELQLENPDDPSVKVLPVCGAYTIARNTEPTSMVDLVKADQIGHNVAMNQLYLLMEREVGKFIIMDANILPRFKDWAGERGMEKFITTARSLGITVADTSPANAKGANAGGQLPKMIDLDESARMLSRLRIAESFEVMAKRRVGFSDQRMGDIGKEETATGVNQGIAKSYTQTRSYFNVFFDYKKRYLRMALNTALHVQSRNPDILLTYNKSDMSRAFFALNGQEHLTTVKLNIYVTDSQEALRQTELIRQLFMNNNNTNISPVDLATMVTSNSPVEMKAQLSKTYEEQQELIRQKQQMEQQAQQMAQQQYEDKIAWEKESFYAKLDNDRELAYIKTFGGINASPTQDVDQNEIPDVLEYDKLAAKADHDNETLKLQKEKNDLSRQKLRSDERGANLDRRLKAKELQTRKEIEDKKLEIAKENRNKYSPGTDKKGK